MLPWTFGSSRRPSGGGLTVGLQQPSVTCRDLRLLLGTFGHICRPSDGEATFGLQQPSAYLAPVLQFRATSDVRDGDPQQCDTVLSNSLIFSIPSSFILIMQFVRCCQKLCLNLFGCETNNVQQRIPHICYNDVVLI